MAWHDMSTFKNNKNKPWFSEQKNPLATFFWTRYIWGCEGQQLMNTDRKVWWWQTMTALLYYALRDHDASIIHYIWIWSNGANEYHEYYGVSLVAQIKRKTNQKREKSPPQDGGTMLFSLHMSHKTKDMTMLHN